ncbi:uncharacterized protein LOC105239565 isoform X2 [Ailuropoda melanoleuca]|uniref:uncharacterized protein LOC105239565 isoform X2 n=1 Tax=Ailuropoda melanoleuca TaxID=9646 RepID=UPI001494913B|nr:uncharacterized protein LOC105239565 isoform X2 [Ailuropoda melanoleuca]
MCFTLLICKVGVINLFIMRDENELIHVKCLKQCLESVNTHSFEALALKISKEGAEICFFLDLCRLEFWSGAVALGWCAEDHHCNHSWCPAQRGPEQPQSDLSCKCATGIQRFKPDSSREEARELRVSSLLPSPYEAKLCVVLLTLLPVKGWLLSYPVPSAILYPPCNQLLVTKFPFV